MAGEPEHPEHPEHPVQRGQGPEPTGDERVDAAVGRLGELRGAPVARHVEVFEDVHRRLQDALASVDEPEGGPEPPA